MKTALCFSGQLRDFEKRKEQWLSFIEKNQCDVYASFWENEKINDFIKIFNPQKIEIESPYILSKDLELFKKDIDNCKISEMNKIANLKNDFKCGNMLNKFLNLNSMSMWYKIWRANSLSKILNYDIVIRARYDIFLPIKVQKNNFLNIPNHKVTIKHWPNCWGLTDIFSYGESRVMDYYCSLFLKYYSLFEKNTSIILAENLLREHLAQKKINIRLFPSKVFFHDDFITDINEEFINSETFLKNKQQESPYGFFKKSFDI